MLMIMIIGAATVLFSSTTEREEQVRGSWVLSHEYDHPRAIYNLKISTCTFLCLPLYILFIVFSRRWMRMCFWVYKCSSRCNYHWLLRICQIGVNRYIAKVLFDTFMRLLTRILLQNFVWAHFLVSWVNTVTVYLKKNWLVISSYYVSSPNQTHKADLRRMSKVKYFLQEKLPNYFWPHKQTLSWGCAGGK